MSSKGQEQYLEISKEQTTLLKGVGILLIVLHNFFHWIAPSVGENEFDFSHHRIFDLFRELIDKPLEGINLFFSYFGHFGVQIFVFISGYGLAKSLSKRSQKFFPFFGRRLAKLYPAFFISFILTLCILSFITQTIAIPYPSRLISNLLMMQTLIPGEAFGISGPWWFYALIVQLYLLSIPLFKLIQKFSWKALLTILALAYSSIFLFNGLFEDRSIYIMANTSGHIAEFALGMYLALYPQRISRKITIPIALAVFIGGNFFYPLYPFTFISIAFLQVVFFRQLFQSLPSLINRILLFFGELSMYMFAINGILRTKPVGWAEMGEMSAGKTLLTAIVFLATVIIVAYCIRLISRPIERLLERKIKRN